MQCEQKSAGFERPPEKRFVYIEEAMARLGAATHYYPSIDGHGGWACFILKDRENGENLLVDPAPIYIFERLVEGRRRLCVRKRTLRELGVSAAALGMPSLG